MSKKCAKCDKTVYPIEELKCLDKSWHKACFKCAECGMMLNMKNYKGYNKIPYCNAHYPTTKHTAVADTPENRRLAKNTAIQSQVKYHADFEKNIKGSKIQVADDPETRRNQLLTKMVSGVEYRGHRDTVQEMESRRDQGGQPQHYPPPTNQQPPAHFPPYSHQQQHQPQHQPQQQQQQQPPDHYPAPSRPQMPPPQMQPPQMPVPHIPVQEPQRAAPAAQPPQAPPANQLGGGSGQTYQAMYDYEAQDDDEVGFIDGDLILDCQSIDEGWMFGTVRRTGQRGMLPANYVEPKAM